MPRITHALTSVFCCHSVLHLVGGYILHARPQRQFRRRHHLRLHAAQMAHHVKHLRLVGPLIKLVALGTPRAGLFPCKFNHLFVVHCRLNVSRHHLFNSE
ncbi:MAG: hypothetical protein U0694_15890 [Anaerolineae bacterium]